MQQWILDGYLLTLAALVLLGGALGDRYGRRRVFVLGLGLFTVALINSVVREQDRGRAVGAWAGLSGVSTALGPLLGGWLVDALSWRMAFLINVPLAVVAIWVTRRHVPEVRDQQVRGRLDIAGTVTIVAGLPDDVPELLTRAPCDPRLLTG